MDYTIQIITKNQGQALQKTLASLKHENIWVNDLGSNDETIQICQHYGVTLTRIYEENRAILRNHLTSLSKTNWHLYLEPGETIIQGRVDGLQQGAYYVSVFSNGGLRKEIRIWDKSVMFRNPCFETLDYVTDQELAITILSNFDKTTPDNFDALKAWQAKEPFNPDPYYYLALLSLATGVIDQFLINSEKFMFLEKQNTIAKTMNHYYYALVMLHQQKINVALNHLNICLSVNPLMAEFWCLMGDIYYHSLKKFEKAIDFYDNAIILGSRRRKDDKWPLEISKYQEYPNLMIKSCRDILDSYGIYQKFNSLTTTVT